ncbi:MAG: hypothetical protein ABJE95_11030 [Byssovorax sp.]
MRRVGAALLLAALSAACGPPMQGLGKPRFVVLAADPTPEGTYQSTLAVTPGVARCAAEFARQPEARFEGAASACLLQTGEESAIADLLGLGVTNERKVEREVTAYTDAVDAATNAGRLAAATSPRELLAMLADPNPSTESFALAALTAMLKIQDKTRDFDASAPGIAAACAPLTASPDARVAITAAGCVEASKQDSAGAALARAYLTTGSADVQAAMATALATLPRAALDDATLHRFADFLATPIANEWFISDVRAREMGCLVLAQHALRAPWAFAAARVASSEMKSHGGSNGQNQPPSCATYAKAE